MGPLRAWLYVREDTGSPARHERVASKSPVSSRTGRHVPRNSSGTCCKRSFSYRENPAVGDWLVSPVVVSDADGSPGGATCCVGVAAGSSSRRRDTTPAATAPPRRTPTSAATTIARRPPRLFEVGDLARRDL